MIGKLMCAFTLAIAINANAESLISPDKVASKNIPKDHILNGRLQDNGYITLVPPSEPSKQSRTFTDSEREGPSHQGERIVGKSSANKRLNKNHSWPIDSDDN